VDGVESGDGVAVSETHCWGARYEGGYVGGEYMGDFGVDLALELFAGYVEGAVGGEGRCEGMEM
jgi:hypothetical protein